MIIIKIDHLERFFNMNWTINFFLFSTMRNNLLMSLRWKLNIFLSLSLSFTTSIRMLHGIPWCFHRYIQCTIGTKEKKETERWTADSQEIMFYINQIGHYVIDRCKKNITRAQFTWVRVLKSLHLIHFWLSVAVGFSHIIYYVHMSRAHESNGCEDIKMSFFIWVNQSHLRTRYLANDDNRETCVSAFYLMNCIDFVSSYSNL